jgi:hypothetical protein
MIRRSLAVAAAALSLAACGSSSKSTAPATSSYKAAASVGDFLRITIHHDTKTIDYTNSTNGDAGTVPYTVRADGCIDITDPHGDLVLACEIPGVAIVAKGDHLGPNGNRQPALLFGVESVPLTKADFKGKSYNYMQFRTQEGGMEVGHLAFDAATGDMSGTSYWPLGTLMANLTGVRPAYQSLAVASSALSDDASLGAVTLVDVNGNGIASTDIIFGTATGSFVVDTPQGAIFGFKAAASSAFDPTKAGSYTAIVYGRDATFTLVQNAPGIESGTPSIDMANVVIGASGSIRITQGSTVIVDTTLSPFAGSAYQGPGKVVDPCPGLFYFTDHNNSPVFVSFFDQAFSFAQFTPQQAPQGVTPATYHYAYGVGVRAP